MNFDLKRYAIYKNTLQKSYQSFYVSFCCSHGKLLTLLLLKQCGQNTFGFAHKLLYVLVKSL